MKIILSQDVQSLGRKGDVKEVAEGYARNYLFPKKLAQMATENAIKALEAKIKADQASEAALLDEQRKLAESIENKKFVIKAKDKKGKLFGSITAKTIAEELAKQGLEIMPKQVIIKQSIKKIGQYPVEVVFSEKVKTKITLEVQGLD